MAEYCRSILKIVVAQICQIIGWHSINSTPLEFMVDLMQEYFLRLSRLAHQYAEILGRTDVNLDDVGLAFQQMNIDIQQLAEYVKNVDSVPCVIAVPKLCVFHDNHLNFLKPGSREVVTRSVHVHEHLPAMNLESSSDEANELYSDENTDSIHVIESTDGQVKTCNMLPEEVFKRPGDPLSEHFGIGKRTKVTDESRPLREIHSVMMTTSGFLSPAREGKLPESRTPAQARTDSPPLNLYPMVPPELQHDKKIKKIVKKSGEDRKLDKENKKKIRERELFKPDKIHESKIKKLVSIKESTKLKSSGTSKTLVMIPPSTCSPPQYVQKEEFSGKMSKKTSPKLKNEKLISGATTIQSEKKENSNFGKLPDEPDKQKLNIFKKISKPRDDKNLDFLDQHKFKDLEMYSNSSAFTFDDTENKRECNEDEIKLDEVKVSHVPQDDIFLNAELAESRSPSSDVYMFDDMSPPGTPSTPKTPELSVPGCGIDQKKRKKDKNNRKKDNIKSSSSRDNIVKNKTANDAADTDLLARPKTPDAPETSLRKDSNVSSTLSFPFFPAFPSAPGLIPHPIHHQMFSRFPISLARGSQTPQSLLQNLSLPPRFITPNLSTDEVPLIEEKLSEQNTVSVANSEKSSCMETLAKKRFRKII